MIKQNKTRKELESQLAIVEGEMSAIKTNISNKNKDLSLKEKIAISLREQIAKFKNTNEPNVSEHAILRYLERVKGIDLIELKKEILSEKVLKMTKTLGGNGSYPNNDFKVVMKNNTVVTIIK